MNKIKNEVKSDKKPAMFEKPDRPRERVANPMDKVRDLHKDNKKDKK